MSVVPLYHSTRGGTPPRTFTDILLQGLAPGSGLYVPGYYPRFLPGEFARLRELSYPELALAILLRLTDIPRDALERIVRSVYTEAVFGTKEITPLVPLMSRIWLLRLSNGPTNSFKDIALQLLAALFEYAILNGKDRRTLNILGATSGDTGSAAIHAVRGRTGMRIFMLSPKGRMSAYQRAQMYSVQADNVFNIVIDGTFDDCQNIVKAVMADLEFKERHRLGVVNSINWARIAAQIIYYYAGYFAVTERDEQQVSFSVPSGNFGNAYSGHYARLMGLPIRKLIVATNENDVLDVFFRTGLYRPRSKKDVFATSSPSMDIAEASNFERLIYDVTGRDAQKTKALWQSIRSGVGFILDPEVFGKIAPLGIVSGSSAHDRRLKTIQRVYRECGVMIDPHTADGVGVGMRIHAFDPDPLVCLETALPVKFEDTMREALGPDIAFPDSKALLALPQPVHELSGNSDAVKEFIMKHA